MSNSYWDKDEFEDLIVKSVLSMYEKVDKNCPTDIPHCRVSKSELETVKKFGLYFQPSDRIALGDEIETIAPFRGCVTFSISESEKNEDIVTTGAYLRHVYFEVEKKNLQSTLRYPNVPGTTYKMIRYEPQIHNGVFLLKTYVHLGKDNIMRPLPVRQVVNHSKELEFAINEVTLLTASINFWMDRQYLWNVQIQQENAKMLFGVYPEQIQSLFYARENPVTGTGRLRPILHWVKSHKRRLRNGTVIDIEKQLRGITEFEMDGAYFKITRPNKEKKR